MRMILTLAIAAVCVAAEPETIALPRHVLTNDGLVVLAQAGVGDGLLVDLVRHKRTSFDTSADALALLARRGISESVLRAVVEKQEQVQLRSPRVDISPIPVGSIVGPGDLFLVPGSNGRKPRGDPDRWYKVSLR